jgi:hypothetical protein
MSKRYPQFDEGDHVKNIQPNKSAGEYLSNAGDKMGSIGDILLTWITIPGITIILTIIFGWIGFGVGFIWFLTRFRK